MQRNEEDQIPLTPPTEFIYEDQDDLEDEPNEVPVEDSSSEVVDFTQTPQTPFINLEDTEVPEAILDEGYRPSTELDTHFFEDYKNAVCKPWTKSEQSRNTESAANEAPAQTQPVAQSTSTTTSNKRARIRREPNPAQPKFSITNLPFKIDGDYYFYACRSNTNTAALLKNLSRKARDLGFKKEQVDFKYNKTLHQIYIDAKGYVLWRMSLLNYEKNKKTQQSIRTIDREFEQDENDDNRYNHFSKNTVLLSNLVTVFDRRVKALKLDPTKVKFLPDYDRGCVYINATGYKLWYQANHAHVTNTVTPLDMRLFLPYGKYDYYFVPPAGKGIEKLCYRLNVKVKDNGWDDKVIRFRVSDNKILITKRGWHAWEVLCKELRNKEKNSTVFKPEIIAFELRNDNYVHIPLKKTIGEATEAFNVKAKEFGFTPDKVFFRSSLENGYVWIPKEQYILWRKKCDEIIFNKKIAEKILLKDRKFIFNKEKDRYELLVGSTTKSKTLLSNLRGIANDFELPISFNLEAKENKITLNKQDYEDWINAWANYQPALINEAVKNARFVFREKANHYFYTPPHNLFTRILIKRMNRELHNHSRPPSKSKFKLGSLGNIAIDKEGYEAWIALQEVKSQPQRQIKIRTHKKTFVKSGYVFEHSNENYSRQQLSTVLTNFRELAEKNGFKALRSNLRMNRTRHCIEMDERFKPEWDEVCKLEDNKSKRRIIIKVKQRLETEFVLEGGKYRCPGDKVLLNSLRQNLGNLGLGLDVKKALTLIGKYIYVSQANYLAWRKKLDDKYDNPQPTLKLKDRKFKLEGNDYYHYLEAGANPGSLTREFNERATYLGLMRTDKLFTYVKEKKAIKINKKSYNEYIKALHAFNSDIRVDACNRKFIFNPADGNYYHYPRLGTNLGNVAHNFKKYMSRRNKELAEKTTFHIITGEKLAIMLTPEDAKNWERIAKTTVLIKNVPAESAACSTATASTSSSIKQVQSSRTEIRKRKRSVASSESKERQKSGSQSTLSSHLSSSTKKIQASQPRKSVKRVIAISEFKNEQGNTFDSAPTPQVSPSKKEVKPTHLKRRVKTIAMSSESEEEAENALHPVPQASSTKAIQIAEQANQTLSNRVRKKRHITISSESENEEITQPTPEKRPPIQLAHHVNQKPCPAKTPLLAASKINSVATSSTALMTKALLSRSVTAKPSTSTSTQTTRSQKPLLASQLPSFKKKTPSQSVSVTKAIPIKVESAEETARRIIESRKRLEREEQEEVKKASELTRNKVHR